MKRLQHAPERGDETVRPRPDSALQFSPPSLRISRLARAASETAPVQLRGARNSQLPERTASSHDACLRTRHYCLQHCFSMAESADLSRVIALANKGAELLMKGHWARAAEKYALAVEEAERVFSGSPDCLITAALRHNHVTALMNHATASAVKPADANDVLKKGCFCLLPTATDVLQRRKVAGTLLPGTCQAVEVTWFRAAMRHTLGLHGFTWSHADAEAQSALVAPYVGLEIFMRVASSLALVLGNTEAQHAGELSDEEIELYLTTCALFLASALELMALPRPGYETWLPGEPPLVRSMRELSPQYKQMGEAGIYAAQQVHNAWQRVLRSGVLHLRNIDEGIAATNQLSSRVHKEAAEVAAAGRLRACALASCAACESHEAQFKRCAACKTVCYCCREHQVADWPAHKAACKKARKAQPSDEAP